MAIIVIGKILIQSVESYILLLVSGNIIIEIGLMHGLMDLIWRLNNEFKWKILQL